MAIKAWQLPWRDEMVPHAVLDILRGCNISCRACYNDAPSPKVKSVEELQQELELLLSFRRLSSVSIVGGEVTLHPQLAEIVAMVKKKGLAVELVSNGVELDQELMGKLADAGLDILYIHVEKGQNRPDLPSDHTFEDINRLRRQKADLVASYQVDVGLTLTIYPGELEELHNAVSFFLEAPEINYFLITLYRDIDSIDELAGDLVSGLHGKGTSTSATWDMREIAKWFASELHLQPFAYLGSNMDRNDPRWLSYFIGVVYENDQSQLYHSLKSSFIEKSAMFLMRVLGQRYPMYMKQNADIFRKQLLFNGLATGAFKRQLQLFKRSKRRGSTITAKRLLIQNPSELDEKGRLIHCNHCPDATIRNGAMVPVCIADKVSTISAT